MKDITDVAQILQGLSYEVCYAVSPSFLTFELYKIIMDERAIKAKTQSGKDKLIVAA